MGCGASTSKARPEEPQEGEVGPELTTLSQPPEPSTLSQPPEPSTVSQPTEPAALAQPQEGMMSKWSIGRSMTSPLGVEGHPTCSAPTSKGSTIIHATGPSGLTNDHGPASLLQQPSKASHCLGQRAALAPSMKHSQTVMGHASVKCNLLTRCTAAPKHRRSLPPEVITSLFRAFDSGGSGVETRLSSSLGAASCAVASQRDSAQSSPFAAFDRDGDGHLEREEISALLRKTIEPSVRDLHAALDFADASDLDALNEEAGGSGRHQRGRGGGQGARLALRPAIIPTA